MSDITFHKSCYTSRSSGYKYRTLSTNTGVKPHRNPKVDTGAEGAFYRLRDEITTRIDNEIELIQESRELIKKKIEKVESKVDRILQVQNTILNLRKNLQNAENSLVNMFDKVNKIESVLDGDTSIYSTSRKSFAKPNLRVPPVVVEEDRNSVCTQYEF